MMKRKMRKGVEQGKKRGLLAVVDALKDRHLVNLRELVDQWEEPCLTLSSQSWLTLSRRVDISSTSPKLIDLSQPCSTTRSGC